MHSVAARGLLVVVAAFALGAETAGAQETNLAVYQRLALECLGELPRDVEALSVEAPDEMPYVRSALIESWRSDGREVFDFDGLPPQSATLPRLAFTVEDAQVTYDALGRRRLNRNVRLAVHYVLSDVDGRILLDERCSEAADDVIDRAERERLEDQVYSETRGDPPRAGWVRRYVEPAVLTAATALGVYLFFTLRSQSTDD